MAKSKAGSQLAAMRKTRMKNCGHCGRRFRAFGKAKFCSDKCRYDSRNHSRKNPLTERFKRINYDTLNAKQQAIYDFQQVAAVLADYGFDCSRLGDDWNGTDFLAHNMLTGDTLKVQLKKEISLDKKCTGKDLWICCPIDGRWLLIPYDVLPELSRETTPQFRTEDGVRSKLEPWLL